MAFQFKQFQVDQSGCAMKINTDGVLLGALVEANEPKSILDIGAGTGVIAMILAQRFPDALIDAVEIDTDAAETSGRNFQESTFNNRLQIYSMGFEEYFQTYPERKYELIISNPPFYINSLESPEEKINLAKHTDRDFFESLVKAAYASLTANGLCWLVLPLPTAVLVKHLALESGLFLQQQLNILSFADSQPHREIIALGLSETKCSVDEFVIYDAPKVYSAQYQNALKDFFTIF